MIESDDPYICTAAVLRTLILVFRGLSIAYISKLPVTTDGPEPCELLRASLLKLHQSPLKCEVLLVYILPPIRFAFVLCPWGTRICT
jgi:hypothetical protein